MLAGGKLGRHPHLAEVVLEMADREQMLAALEGAVRVIMEHGRDGERLAGLVERLGMDRVREMIIGSDAGNPEARIQNNLVISPGTWVRLPQFH